MQHPVMPSISPVLVFSAAVVHLEMKLARKRLPSDLTRLQQVKEGAVEYLDC